ncbi:MAG: RidA family protein [Methyloligellaceae bacterium]
MSKNITRLNPPTMPNSENMGYSQISIVEPGRMAYVSGQVAIPPDGGPVPLDIAAQSKIASANAKAALDALGATPQDIAILHCFITDLDNEKMEKAFPIVLEMLDGAMPSITGIGVAALASPDFMIEIELTVRLPD